MPTQVGLISLGCAKNLIDSEIMVGHLQQEGMIMTPEPDLADVLIPLAYPFPTLGKLMALLFVPFGDRKSVV